MALSSKRTHFFSSHSPTSVQSESSPAPLQAPRPSSSATEQAAELLKITNLDRTQLQKVQRLRHIKASFSDTAESGWIDSTICDVADAAHGLAVLLEPTRTECEVRNGRLGLGTQLRWKYRDGQPAIQKFHRLLACHKSLVGVLGHLQRVGLSSVMASGLYELEAGEASSTSVPVFPVSATATPGVIVSEPVWEPIKTRDGDRSECVVEKQVDEKIVAEKLDAAMGKTTEKADYEMNDLLSWRRSRGAVYDTKSHVI